VSLYAYAVDLLNPQPKLVQKYRPRKDGELSKCEQLTQGYIRPMCKLNGTVGIWHCELYRSRHRCFNHPVTVPHNIMNQLVLQQINRWRKELLREATAKSWIKSNKQQANILYKKNAH